MLSAEHGMHVHDCRRRNGDTAWLCPWLPAASIGWCGNLLKAFTCKNEKDIFDSTRFAEVFNWRYQNPRT